MSQPDPKDTPGTFPYQKGPWTVNSSTVPYANPWLHVREDQVTRPDGKPGIYGVATIIDGVSVVAIDSGNNVLLTKEFRYAVAHDSIEVISGGVEPGVSVKDTVAAELREEVGLVAAEVIPLGSIELHTSIIAHTGHLFLARGLSTTEAQPEGTEIIELLKVPFEQALQWAYDGTITHAPSVIALLRAQHYLQQNP